MNNEKYSKIQGKTNLNENDQKTYVLAKRIEKQYFGERFFLRKKFHIN